MLRMSDGRKRPCAVSGGGGECKRSRLKRSKNKSEQSESCAAAGDDEHIFATVHQRDDISLLTLTKQFVLEIKRRRNCLLTAIVSFLQ